MIVDTLVGILGLAIGLVLLSYFGHLFWLGLCWLCRNFFIGPSCLHCGQALNGRDTCAHCSSRESVQEKRKPSIDEDLQAAERLRQYAGFQGWLDAEQNSYLLATLNRLRARLGKEPLPNPVVPNPVVPEASVPQPAAHVVPVAVHAEPVGAPAVQPVDAWLVRTPSQPIPQIEVSRSATTPSPEPAAAVLTTASVVKPHALDLDYEPPVAPSGQATTLSPAPMRAEVLRSFMERSNIRWVELVSAALVVVCSVGLVISLWSTLSRTSRFFPSLVFMLATLAVHGAGQYTLRRWKLRTTSRGILHIGLMLIPLSVMVGILLAHRQGVQTALELNVGSGLAIGVGLLVYSGLAITATRALFSKYFLPIALCNILASAALVPIDVANGPPRFIASPSAASLLGVVITSMIVSLLLSHQAAWRGRWTNAFARRHMGMAVQTLFVSLTTCVFWYLKFKPSWSSAALTGAFDFHQWWWLAVGLMGIAWSAWGWFVSLARGSLVAAYSANNPSSSSTKLIDRDASWFVVASWMLASVATLALCIGLWQSNHGRLSTILLLSIGGLWWILHGVVSRLSLPQLAGSMALLLAMAMSGETLHIGWQEPLAAIQWIGQERLTWMTIVGAFALVATAAALWSTRSANEQGSAFDRISQRPDQFLFKHGLMAAGAMMLVSACLTVLASLLPLGPTPFGGQWSAWYLVLYGLALSSMGIVVERDRRLTSSVAVAGWITPWLLPIGLAISTLATVRFMQASDKMPEWIIALRPTRAWSVGVMVLATSCSLVAVVLKHFGWPTRPFHATEPATSRTAIGSVHWLNLFAICLSLISLTGVVRLSDHLALVSGLAWLLPLLFAAVWWTWQSSHAREFMLLSACAWSAAALYWVGHERHWWHETPLVVSMASHVALIHLVCLFAAVAYRQCMARSRPSDSEPTDAGHAWLWRPDFWAQPLLIIAALAVMLLTLGFPALANLGVGLGLAKAGEVNAPGVPLVFLKPGVMQTMGVAGTIILWSVTAAISSRLPIQLPLRVVLGFSPLLIALLLTAAVPAHHAVTVCVAALAVCLIASEGLALLGSQWQEHSESSWRLLSSLQFHARVETNGVLLGRLMCVCSLLGLTALTIFLGWEGSLPANLLPAVQGLTSDTTLDFWPRRLAVWSWMWPAVSFLLLRWSLAVARDVGPTRISHLGIALSLLVACSASLVAMAASHPWLYGAIAWLQWFVIATALLAGATAAATLLRNFIGLRAMDRGQSAAHVLLRKAAGGSRWKRAVSGSLRLQWFGLGGLITICLMAAVTNIWFTVRSPESVQPLATWPTFLAYAFLSVVVAGLWNSKEPQRQWTAPDWLASYAGLVALLLGMLAPLEAVFYADWLVAVPSRVATVDQTFHPYRAQIALWLVALAIGLVVRLSTGQKRWPVSGEAAWISLASLVGVLGLVSSAIDPQPMWATAELAGLALIAVLSGCLSGQVWRGHVAAILAGIACCVWSRGTASIKDALDVGWQIAIGPLTIAAISLVWHVVSQRRHHGAGETGALGPDAASSPIARAWKSVDQTVSQHVPIYLCLLSGLWVFASEIQPPELHWPIIGAVGAGAWLLAMGRLWDARRGGRGIAIYTAFIAVALTVAVLVGHLNELPLKTRGLIWMACGLGALATMAGCVRQWLRDAPQTFSKDSGPASWLIARREDFDAARRWLVPCHSLIGLLLLFPCLILALVLDERGLRLANAALPLLSGLSILPIAIDAHQRLGRSIGLWLTSLPLILFLWADLAQVDWHVSEYTIWHYAQRTMLAFVLLGWGHWMLSRWLSGKLDWPEQLHSSSWISMTGAAAIGGWMLLSVASGAWPSVADKVNLGSQMAWLLAWCGLIGRALQFALRPMGLDQQASLRARQFAVYVVEAGLVCLAYSIYQCFPELFKGLIADWWPLVVYAIAMLSAGIGHWATLKKQEVLADPVRRSSLLLPLVPLLGVWLPFSRQLDIDWSQWQSYSMVLFGGAALYALHGWLKPSVKVHAVAGVLVLLSFWALLHSRPSLQFFEHPQFWIVPPAIGGLIFVEINRRRLDAGVVTATRYVAILLAYLSSTAEIVLKAFDGQMWQPLVLLMLAVVGVLAGIALRVRAFLFCGATFVMVALLGMVWHAQQAIDQVWPWWAFGILTGVSLIAMLGYFEKNRPRVLAYVERLKSWEL